MFGVKTDRFNSLDSLILTAYFKILIQTFNDSKEFKIEIFDLIIVELSF